MSLTLITPTTRAIWPAFGCDWWAAGGLIHCHNHKTDETTTLTIAETRQRLTAVVAMIQVDRTRNDATIAKDAQHRRQLMISAENVLQVIEAAIAQGDQMNPQIRAQKAEELRGKSPSIIVP